MPILRCGCGLVAEVRDARLQAVRGDEDHPVNQGLTWRKPLALPEAVGASDRALKPLVRNSGTGRFREAVLEGQLLTEDYYAVNKLAKGFLGTNNVDSNSRLCMSSAVAAYDATFGSDGPPPAYADLELTDCILLWATTGARSTRARRSWGGSCSASRRSRSRRIRSCAPATGCR